MKTLTLGLAGLLSLASVTADAQAQNTRYIPVKGGSASNLAPFGIRGGRFIRNVAYQTLATFEQLGSPKGPIRITNIGFLPSDRGAILHHHDRITITLAQTDRSTLSTTFTENTKTNGVKVLDATNYEWKGTAGTWSRIGFDRSYSFDPAKGKNLVLDILVYGNDKCLGTGLGGFIASTGPRMVASDFQGPRPKTGSLIPTLALSWAVDIDAWSANEHGKACEQIELEVSGSAELGKQLGIKLSGAPQSALSVLLMDVKALEPSPLVPGTKACRLYVAPTGVLATTDLKQAVPMLPSLIGSRLFAQFASFDSSYPAGVATSDYARITVGKAQ